MAWFNTFELTVVLLTSAAAEEEVVNTKMMVARENRIYATNCSLSPRWWCLKLVLFSATLEPD